MIINSQVSARDQRAATLDARQFNGVKFGLITLTPAGPNPTAAQLEVFFYNPRFIVPKSGEAPVNKFSLSGGQRLPAGQALGQVQITNISPGTAPDSLLLTIAPIGDYSTYTLSLADSRFDPLFSDLDFKFRPGCFGIDCAPDWDPAPAPQPAPAIDYLAKDYESFRHILASAMSLRVPGWQPSSEADLDQTLIDLIAASGDELSDYQDRVMNEAYLATCRNRVSLARHARLMDYHIHQGCQASTWLALTVQGAQQLAAAELQVRTGMRSTWNENDVIFSTRQTHLHSSQRMAFNEKVNTLRLYTWEATRPSLKAGATTADLLAVLPGQPEAQTVAALLTGRPLLLQEHINPATGAVPGRSMAKRQIVNVLAAAAMQDAVTTEWFIRITWDSADALRADFCFTVFCEQGMVTDCALFHGNLVRVHHGATVTAHFRESGTYWSSTEVDSAFEKFRFYERTERYGTLCRLPLGPLAYLDTPEGGIVAPVSSLRRVDLPGAAENPPPQEFEAHITVDDGGVTEIWDEVISLVHSDDSSENGDHFAVETDERFRSLLRFGNGINGRALPPNAVVHLRYQLGGSHAGNIGADSLLIPVSTDTVPAPNWITACWNPFDVVNGRDPEPVERIIRHAPEAFRARQLRAVTLADYIRRAEQVPGVSRAVARYAWTGSWRTVRITLDPLANAKWPAVLNAAESQLNTVHLIGEDLEIRPPRFVPLQIIVRLCLLEECWAEDVRFILEQEFSTGWTPDGRQGFFHPDLWTFGQSLHRSQIEGRIQRVPGIEHLISIKMKRFNDRHSVPQAIEELKPRFDEIFQVMNDPDSQERGSIEFELRGGRI